MTDLVILPEDINKEIKEISDMQVDGPMFPALSAKEMQAVDVEYRKIPVPHNRITPLRQNWLKIYEPLVDYMKLQVRMNVKRRCVELRTSEDSTENSSLQKGADFVRAFTLGFDVDDAIALLRLDELYIDSFEIRDVKSLTGDHMSRAIGRVAGKSGKTKFAIENATRTRIVVADSKIHILGSYQNTILAKRAIVSLILGSPPGKVYGNLKNVATRMKQSL